MTPVGQVERFPPTRLSAGYGFRKETIAGLRRDGRDAPEAVVSVVAIVGATATEEAAGWLEYPEEWVPAHPSTQARTACSNGATPKIAIARFTL